MPPINPLQPTKKSPAIEDMLEVIMRRTSTILEGKCASCSTKTLMFRDAPSINEYRISGMCQRCQDTFYESPELQKTLIRYLHALMKKTIIEFELNRLTTNNDDMNRYAADIILNQVKIALSVVSYDRIAIAKAASLDES